MLHTWYTLHIKNALESVRLSLSQDSLSTGTKFREKLAAAKNPEEICSLWNFRSDGFQHAGGVFFRN